MSGGQRAWRDSASRFPLEVPLLSIWAKKWAYEQTVGQPGAKAVLVALAEFANEAGFCFSSQKTLSAMTELSERSVRQHLAFLEDKGFLRRDERRGEGGKWTSDGHTLLAPVESLRPPHSQRRNLPTEESADGRKRHGQRQNSPAAKSAAKPLEDLDEPLIEPSNIYVESASPPSTEGNGTGKSKSRTAIANDVFTYWQEVLKHPHAKFDGKRRRAVERRLAEGYTLDFIRGAIRGIRQSPHHMG
jgi:DNA-binding transcriptional ArsR family regulator